MITQNRYVIDTVSLINYFRNIFEENDMISANARRIISSGFDEYSTIKLIIPSVVLIELHTKFIINEEICRKIYYEMYYKLHECPDIEIKPIEREVIEEFIKIDDDLEVLEHNDKLILSSAFQLNCPIITTDPKIIRYINKCNYPPGYIS